MNRKNNELKNEKNKKPKSNISNPENNVKQNEKIDIKDTKEKTINSQKDITSNEEIIQENNNSDKNTNKIKSKVLKINGISIWRILAYFIIYSVLGYIIETLYGICTKGVWESRQSFLYGPFCGIYGLGAVIMIIFLYKYQKKYNILFFGGFILGSIIEYIVSWFGEMILGVKWWDYSGMPLNLNGRICVYFSIFWGFLGIYLIASLNPKIDRIINWTKKKFKSIKTLKAITITLIILLLIDCIATGFAISFFKIRMIVENNIEVSDKDKVIEAYDSIYTNEKLSGFIYKYWGDKKMIRTFPNLKVIDKNNNIVYLSDFVDVQPYYLKVVDKNQVKSNEEVVDQIKGE